MWEVQCTDGEQHFQISVLAFHSTHTFKVILIYHSQQVNATGTHCQKLPVLMQLCVIHSYVQWRVWSFWCHLSENSPKQYSNHREDRIAGTCNMRICQLSSSFAKRVCAHSQYINLCSHGCLLPIHNFLGIRKSTCSIEDSLEFLLSMLEKCLEICAS